MVTTAPKPEFDRPLMLDRITTDAVVYQDQAKDDECMAVAVRLGVVGLRNLGYDLTVMLVHKDTTVSVTGKVEALVTLECSITLEEFDHSVTEDVALELTMPGQGARDREAVPHEELELDEAEALFPEVIDGNEINLGEIAVEALSLALPEYPRAPNATLPDGVQDEETAEKSAEKADTHRPFAKLAVLKDYQKNRQEQ